MAFTEIETLSINYNCLFHSVFYGLVTNHIELSQDKLECLYEIIEQELSITIDSSPNLQELFLLLAKQYPGWRELELQMGKVLRSLTVLLMEKHAAALKVKLLPSLKSAFSEYVNTCRNATAPKEGDDIFKPLPSFQKKFAEIYDSVLLSLTSKPELTRDQIDKELNSIPRALISWWDDEGYTTFQTEMKESGQMAGDIELELLADFFNFSVNIHQNQSSYCLYSPATEDHIQLDFHYNPRIRHWNYLELEGSSELTQELKDQILKLRKQVSSKKLISETNNLLNRFFQMLPIIEPDKTCFLAFQLYKLLRKKIRHSLHNYLTKTQKKFLEDKFSNLEKRISQIKSKVKLKNTYYLAALIIYDEIFQSEFLIDDACKLADRADWDDEEIKLTITEINSLPCTEDVSSAFKNFYANALDKITNSGYTSPSEKKEKFISYIKTIQKETHLKKSDKLLLKNLALFEFATFLQITDFEFTPAEKQQLLISIGYPRRYSSSELSCSQYIFKDLFLQQEYYIIDFISDRTKALDLIAQVLSVHPDPYNENIKKYLMNIINPEAWEQTEIPTDLQKATALIYLSLFPSITTESAKTMLQRANRLIPNPSQQLFEKLPRKILQLLAQKGLLTKQRSSCCCSFWENRKHSTTRYRHISSTFINPIPQESGEDALPITFRASCHTWTLNS